jgi:hypothetical protein
VGPRADLDAVVKRKIPNSCREVNGSQSVEVKMAAINKIDIKLLNLNDQ